MLYQRLVGWLYGMSPFILQNSANDQVLSFRFLIFSVSRYILSLLSSAFCFICYRFIQTSYCLSSSTRISSRFKFHVYPSPNHRYRKMTVIAFSRNLYSTLLIIKPPIIHQHHASTLHPPTLHLTMLISPENLNLHPMPNTAPTI
jgi:hypothetical protein